MDDYIQVKIEQLKRKKLELLANLGQSIYHQYRIGNIYSDELREYAEQILEIDQKIFQYQTEDEKESQYSLCQCGNLLSDEDLYCGKCGKKVLVHPQETKEFCQVCEIELIPQSKFCHVCGTRQVEKSVHVHRVMNE